MIKFIPKNSKYMGKEVLTMNGDSSFFMIPRKGDTVLTDENPSGYTVQNVEYYYRNVNTWRGKKATVSVVVWLEE
jgi:hypothetical protein